MINNPYVLYGRKARERLEDIPKNWEQSLAEVGIENFRWHGQRHTFARRRVVLSGVDLYSVKDLLGRLSIDMIQKYTRLSPN